MAAEPDIGTLDLSEDAPRARVAKTLVTSAAPLVVSLLLQYSITGVAIFLVSGLGKKELASVSLASMICATTGYAVFQGIASSLDTLCAQAYGAGKKQDVGLHVQRVIVLLALALILVGALWLNIAPVLSLVLDDTEVIGLAAAYLRILLIGIPGWALFECAKRFLQAQNLFTATTYILLVIAPLNIFLHWLLMYVLDLGILGSAISVSTSNILLPVGTVLYVVLIDGSECWCWPSRRIWQDWLPMVKMSLYGVVMIATEWIAFEILTLAAGRLGRNELAVQGILMSIGTYASQVPIALGTATAMLTGQLYGAGMARKTEVAIQAGFLTALAQGLLSSAIICSLDPVISRATSEDTEMLQLMQRTVPIVAALQLADAFVQVTGALLRALGRQHLASWLSLSFYVVFGLPLSYFCAFELHLGLYGLWVGPGSAAVIIGTIQTWYLSTVSLEESCHPKHSAEYQPLLGDVLGTNANTS